VAARVSDFFSGKFGIEYEAGKMVRREVAMAEVE